MTHDIEKYRQFIQRISKHREWTDGAVTPLLTYAREIGVSTVGLLNSLKMLGICDLDRADSNKYKWRCLIEDDEIDDSTNQLYQLQLDRESLSEWKIGEILSILINGIYVTAEVIENNKNGCIVKYNHPSNNALRATVITKSSVYNYRPIRSKE